MFTRHNNHGQERKKKRSLKSEDPEYRERLDRAKVMLVDNLAWKDIVLRRFEREITDLSGSILDNDEIDDQEREIQRQTRKTLITIRQSVLIEIES